MKPEDLSLTSVNWEHGMLLTPEHFLRQERYVDSALLWILRYATNAYGLVGGGPRLPEAERGAVRHDPIVVVSEDADFLNLSVTQCRGLTPAGCIIEIDPEHPLQRKIPKAELEGVAESNILIVCQPHDKEVIDGDVDQFNPQMKTERRPAYWLGLQVPAESLPYAITVGSLRRQRYGAGYEKNPDFIPACTSLVSYSELTAAWRKIVDNVTLLLERYTELHRAMREFMVLFTERGIETEVDAETTRFVDRMVVALQDCIYDILDPAQTPQRFFGSLRRLLNSAATYLDLTPAVQQYFETLRETGETEFIAPLEQQKQILHATRTWEVHDDLGVDVRAVLQALGTLYRLEQALEGKYIDFRISPSLEAMNFIFDRGGKVLYRLSAKPARVQGAGDELTIHFAQLRLEGRDKYRLILVGEQNAVFEKGTKITVEIRINEGAGFRRHPIILPCESKTPEQRNFEFDFDAPDVPTITDLRVSLQAHYPIRTALLFIRHRFFAGRTQEAPRTAEPVYPAPAMPSPVERVRDIPPPERVRDVSPDRVRDFPPERARDVAPERVRDAAPERSRDFPPQRLQPQEPPQRQGSRLDPREEPAPDPRDRDRERAPWEQPAAPPRRRRLE